MFMRLSVKNIAYVNETHFASGKITVFVMLKDYGMNSARLYEMSCFDDMSKIVPNTVFSFMNTHKCELIEHNVFMGYTIYQYN